MGTGFALVLRFCGTLGYGFIGGASFGGGTRNGVRFGEGNGGRDGRSGKGGGGLESERFRFGFGFPHCAALGKDFKAVAITIIINDLIYIFMMG